MLAVLAAAAMLLERRYRWAAKMTSCVLALLAAMLLSNIGLIPFEAKAYDWVWSIIVPLAIPLLLTGADLKRIWRDSGRLLLIFLISSLGTLFGAFLAYAALHTKIPQLPAATAMMTATYTGGSVNLVAMADAFHVDKQLLSAAVVADNLLMALYFFALLAFSSLRFFLKHFRHPLIERQASEPLSLQQHVASRPAPVLSPTESSDASTAATAETQMAGPATAAATAETVTPSPASNAPKLSPTRRLLDLVFSLAFAGAIAFLATRGAQVIQQTLVGDGFVLTLGRELLGNKYLLLTTFSVLAASLWPRAIGGLQSAKPLGTYLIHIFFAVIGAPAAIALIVSKAPLLIVFCAIIVGANMLVSLLGGKLFGFTLEEILVASNANIGGPTTASAFAVAKGWQDLVVPALLVGTLGYVLGNYYGLLVGTLLGA